MTYAPNSSTSTSFSPTARGLTGTLTLALLLGCTATDDGLEPDERELDDVVLATDDDASAIDELVAAGRRQTPQQAFQADVELAAAELDLPQSLVADKLAFQRDFARRAGRIAARYPDRIEAIWLEPLPEIRGHVRFVGEVPADLRDEAWLTAAGSDRIELSGGGTATWLDHVRHAELAAAALVEAGHTNHLTYFDPASGRVVVEMKRPAGEAVPTRGTVRRLVEDRIVASAAAGDPRLGLVAREEIAAALEIELVVHTGPGPIIELERRGGAVVRDDGVFECTSGWSVFGPQGFGMLTAGHCNGINELVDGMVVDLSWRDQINGSQGDVEYHSSSVSTLAEFWANSLSIRDVNEYWTGLQIWPFPPILYTGDSVCQYGRASNSRSCNKTITATGVTVSFTDGITRGNLVQTDNHTGIGGDSGGGWSFGTTAYGTHVGGAAGGSSYFTPLVVAVDELDVMVLTQ